MKDACKVYYRFSLSGESKRWKLVAIINGYALAKSHAENRQAVATWGEYMLKYPRPNEGVLATVLCVSGTWRPM